MSKKFNKQEMIAFSKYINSELSKEDLHKYFNEIDLNYLPEIVEHLQYFNHCKEKDFYKFCMTYYSYEYLSDSNRKSFLMTLKTVMHLNRKLFIEDLKQMVKCEFDDEYNFTEMLEGYY